MFALITRDLNEIVRTRRDISPIPRENLASGKPYWVPVQDVVDDQSTGSETITMPPAVDIQVDKVVRTVVIRDKTAEEIEGDNQKMVDRIDLTGVERALAQAIFRLANDVRVLEGKDEITPAQFKNYLKGLLRG